MHIRLRTLWSPKSGNSAEEYEDAFWPQSPIDRELDLFRAAVADGATEASFAGVWARILVRAYCRDQIGGKKLSKFLPRLCGEWKDSVGDKPLPWYAEQKAAQGGFSTLTGLTLYGDSRFSASSIGDSCLFQIRDERVVVSFPMERSAQFGSRPILLSSSGSGADSFVTLAGNWQPGDTFYLMTDALAAWFLRCVESSSVPMIPSDEFDQWIANLRRSGDLKNDDVTVMEVALALD